MSAVAHCEIVCGAWKGRFRSMKGCTICGRQRRLSTMSIVSTCSTGISNQPICCCSKTGCGWPTLAWRNCSPVRRTGAGPMREPERPNTWLLSKYAHGMLVFGVEYPFDSLTGAGSIQGYPVKCISAEWMVKFRAGYELMKMIIVMFLRCVSDSALLCLLSTKALLEKVL